HQRRRGHEAKSHIEADPSAGFVSLFQRMHAICHGYYAERPEFDRWGNTWACQRFPHGANSPEDMRSWKCPDHCRLGRVSAFARKYTMRRRRLSSITLAPCRRVMGVPRPAFAGGAVGSECNLVVFDTDTESARRDKGLP